LLRSIESFWRSTALRWRVKTRAGFIGEGFITLCHHLKVVAKKKKAIENLDGSNARDCSSCAVLKLGVFAITVR